jgi:glycosyltransferase involved in cell wall biosynthesis
MSEANRLKIVVLDGNFYCTKQLFCQLSDVADILLLNPQYAQHFYKIHGHYSVDLRSRQIDDYVWQQDICLPKGWINCFWPLSEAVLILAIKGFCDAENSILVSSYPQYATIAKKLKMSSIYYNFDDYSYHFPKHMGKINHLEVAAVKQADLTICTALHRAKHLQTNIPEKSAQIHHLPNGCSPQFMVDAVLSSPKVLPVDLPGVKHPIAGYIGTLSNGFDFDYLHKVAINMPEVTFLLGGSLPQASEAGSVEWWQGYLQAKTLPNIHFLGYIPHEQISNFMQSFDVLLMCYSVSKFNQSICPTKLWDYMGTSRPIVSNNVVPEVNLWQDVILVANNPDEYREHIYRALKEPLWKAEQRLKIAHQHTWSNLGLKLRHIMTEQLSLPLSQSLS